MSVTNTLYAIALAIIPLISAKPAGIGGTCDNTATLYVSYNAGGIFENVVTTGSWDKEGLKEVIPCVTSTTILRVTCTDTSGPVGGFIATVWYDGQQYSTTEPLSAGNWRLINADSGTIDEASLTYAVRSDPTTVWYNGNDYWPQRIGAAADAYWVWNNTVWHNGVDYWTQRIGAAADAYWVWNTANFGYAGPRTLTFEFAANFGYAGPRTLTFEF
eukprot:77779_1